MATAANFSPSSRLASGTHPSRWADRAQRGGFCCAGAGKIGTHQVGTSPNSKGGARRPLALATRHFGRPLSRETQDYLAYVIDRGHFPYAEIPVTKATGKRRVLYSPEPELMALQRGLLDALLQGAVPHPAAFAYRTGLSTVDCANVHLRAHTIIRLDIADFFPSIRERHVFNALMTMNPPADSADPRLSRLAAYELACLTTVSPTPSQTWVNRGTGLWGTNPSRQIRGSFWYPDQREGFLPQGAPTSGALSNLVMRDLDELIYRLAVSLGLRYTRYSDDMYFSARKPIAQHAIDHLVAEVREALSAQGFHLNDRKTYVAGAGGRRSVLGIIVDGASPRLPREYKRRVDHHVRAATTFGIQAHSRHRGFETVQDLDSHVSGLLSYARMVEPGWADPRWDTWRRLRSLGSQSDSVVDDLGWGALLPNADQQDPTTGAIAKASIDALIHGANRYRQGSEYLELLRFVGRFRKYAPFNAMLVDLQRRGTRYVLTADKWLSDFRRVLKPGAQPLVILQPRGPFMVVYDVGDTEALPGARPLPREITDPLGIQARINDGAVLKLWDRTVSNAVRDGVRVTLVDTAAHSAGSTYWGKSLGTVSRPAPRSKGPEEVYRLRHEIEVNRNLAPIDRYTTLVHELAHIYLGHIGTPNPDHWPDRWGGTDQRDEIEAESITYMLMARLDAQVEMGDYILAHARTSADTPSDIALNLMFKVAGEIIEMGQKRLPARPIKP